MVERRILDSEERVDRYFFGRRDLRPLTLVLRKNSRGRETPLYWEEEKRLQTGSVVLLSLEFLGLTCAPSGEGKRRKQTGQPGVDSGSDSKKSTCWIRSCAKKIKSKGGVGDRGDKTLHNGVWVFIGGTVRAGEGG